MDPTRGVLVISWLAGFAMFVDGVMPKVQPKLPVGVAVLMALAAGPLLMFSLVFVEAMLTAGTGRLLGGQARPLQLRAALAWANAPLLWLLVLWPAQAVVAAPRLAIYTVSVALFLWAETLAVVLVSEVHRFSVGRSLGTIFLGWLIKIGVIIGILLALVGAEHGAAPAPPAIKSPEGAAISP